MSRLLRIDSVAITNGNMVIKYSTKEEDATVNKHRIFFDTKKDFTNFVKDGLEMSDRDLLHILVNHWHSVDSDFSTINTLDGMVLGINLNTIEFIKNF